MDLINKNVSCCLLGLWKTAEHRLQSRAHADLLYWRRYPQISNCLRTPPVENEPACTKVYSTGRLICADSPQLRLFLMPLCDHVPGLGCSFWE